MAATSASRSAAWSSAWSSATCWVTAVTSARVSSAASSAVPPKAVIVTKPGWSLGSAEIAPTASLSSSVRPAASIAVATTERVVARPLTVWA